MVPIVKKIVPTSKYNIKCPYEMTPTRIVVHNTANDASARNEISYMTNNDYETSFHYAVDDIEIVQGIEENRNAWHAGDGNGVGNREGIAIEICYSLSGGELYDKAIDNATDLVVDILTRYGWGIDKVTKHQDYSGKYCPHRILDNGWDNFINVVNNKLNNVVKEEYELVVDIPIYMNSIDAYNKENSVGYYDKGMYYIYKKDSDNNNIINITKDISIPGGWINTLDNYIENTKDNEDDNDNIDNDIDSNDEEKEDNNIDDNNDNYYDNIEKNNPLLYLIEAIINFIKKLFSSK